MANKDESFKNMETLAEGLRRPGEVGFELDPEFAKMSKRERKRYVKKVHKELDRELAGKRHEIRDARAAAKEAERTQAKSAAEVTKKLKERSSKSDKLTAEQRRRRDNAKNVVDAIGYNRMFENGICEVGGGLLLRDPFLRRHHLPERPRRRPEDHPRGDVRYLQLFPRRHHGAVLRRQHAAAP